MKIIKNIIGAVCALWAAILFIVTMIPALVFYMPCFLLKEPQKARWHRAVSHVWMLVFIYGSGCSLSIKGKNNFKKDINYVVVSNHNSLMDVPVTTPFLPRANKTIAKKSMSKIPLFGWIYKFGSVLVDRKDERSRRKSIIAMRYMLKQGLDMVIYPEGTRNRTDKPLKDFYNGAFKLAVDTGKPVIPIILFNTKKILPANKVFYFMPHKMKLHILPAIESTGKTVDALRDEAFKTMWDYQISHEVVSNTNRKK